MVRQRSPSTGSESCPLAQSQGEQNMSKGRAWHGVPTKNLGPCVTPGAILLMAWPPLGVEMRFWSWDVPSAGVTVAARPRTNGKAVRRRGEQSVP